MGLVFFLLQFLELFGDVIWQTLGKGLKLIFSYLADAVVELMANLPTSAFLAFPDLSGASWDTALGWLNWLVPVSELETALTAYAAAIFAYYVFKRLRKVVEK